MEVLGGDASAQCDGAVDAQGGHTNACDAAEEVLGGDTSGKRGVLSTYTVGVRTCMVLTRRRWGATRADSAPARTQQGGDASRQHGGHGAAVCWSRRARGPPSAHGIAAEGLSGDASGERVDAQGGRADTHEIVVEVLGGATSEQRDGVLRTCKVAMPTRMALLRRAWLGPANVGWRRRKVEG
ncbi:hypothetical protein PLICRDRAFT_177066 [Plicaturopsis crispa FD-325 SS-3]|nr:hypothetical protein PLICRDRAFT_177066 [Plicaturopsis crispa FD-325 SS-3]